MEPSTNLAIGMAAAVSIVVTPDMTVGYFVPGMPQVYATPMMILHMEMAAGVAVAAALPLGYVSVGMSVDIRHLAATPIGGRVRAVARVKSIDSKSVLFEIEAWNDLRKIGAGTHRRGIVNVPEFERRAGVHQAVS
ncbi:MULTISPECIES: hotdog domain-containing protein [unclassified Bradyrhizobium]|jgi:fluoroacetyl-CoA thioesterase|uniref:thioesterase family protein n=1 Tax=unclassified Bradyrhizobium TaxID=2631580 RepID=UPI001FF96D02|nr:MULTISPECIES: hotdog domain-containing protein [unclassified Bradyrhizobium]MCK1483835.1 thioesterase [Bradyrhizobium sp. 193]MCK1500294.1 thioesterase [Bradyrhizobium sp. 188]MCK1568390.1 thioesterase [Bradyrhizobium sp. 173]UPJ74153.1 thioesterase [Bradyrhizobium sp. 187]UPJ84807.1 thioesterase [Bradyrhizobium sp. 184]